MAEDVVLHSFKCGYRHVSWLKIVCAAGRREKLMLLQVDSARAYRNEGPCAEAIKKSGIRRSEIFLTSKVPPRAIGYEQTKSSVESSLAQTGLEYIDL